MNNVQELRKIADETSEIIEGTLTLKNDLDMIRLSTLTQNSAISAEKEELTGGKLENTLVDARHNLRKIKLVIFLEKMIKKANRRKNR